MRNAFIVIICLLYHFSSAQFIPNKGQWKENILFRKNIPGGTVFFEEGKLTYHLAHAKNFAEHGHAPKRGESDTANNRIRLHAYEMQFVNSDRNAVKKGVQASAEKLNFFIGNDTSKWTSNVSTFEKVRYNGLYPGIDFLFYEENERPKYDFIVHAGAAVSDIKLKYNGVRKMCLEHNELKIQLSFSDVVEQLPIAYQVIAGKKVSVPCHFVLHNGVVSFTVGESYNKAFDLVIDPLLIFSTYSGSTADNFGYTATYDEDGFLYAGSTVFWMGYPTSLGAFDSTWNGTNQFYNVNGEIFGSPDIAITKYDTSGTKRIYSTFLGGWFCEVPHSLVVNSKGELLIYGTTGSDDFPVTKNALDTSFGGGNISNLANGIFVNYFFGSDIILSKLSADGSKLLASTYYGGTKNDGLNERLNYNYADQMRGEVIVDKDDNVFIASSTSSSDIANVSGFQNTKNLLSDALVAHFSADLSTQIWATYLGGNENDAAYSIVLDAQENLVLAGGTTSPDLATTLNALYPMYQGNPSDGFIAKISNDGSLLNALTYFGTAAYDQVYFVKIDKLQNIYVYGQSESMDSTLVKNAKYHSVHSGQFVSKLKNDLSDFIWSTTFGSGDGRVNISPTAFMVDLCNKVYLTGWGSNKAGFDGLPNYLKGGAKYNGAQGSDGMEVTPDAMQPNTLGSDFYIMVLEDDASQLSYASFFGGDLSSEHVDGGTSRFDKKGKIYQAMCAGCGGHSDMVIAPANAVSPENKSNNCNIGVFKMDFLIPNVVADFKASDACATQNYTFKNSSLLQKNTSFHWDFGDGASATQFEPTHKYVTAGDFVVKLRISDPTACNLVDSISKTIHVQSYKTQVLAADTICAGESVQIGFAENPNYSSYLWRPAMGLSDSAIANPIASPAKSTNYVLLANKAVCQDSFLFALTVIPVTGFLTTSADADTILKGHSTQLHVAPIDLAVLWKPAASLSGDTLHDPVASPLVSTTYTVSLKTNAVNSCISTDSITVFVYDGKCGKNDVYVPNIFTPNADAKNDVLFVRGNNITELYFTIYDRWGEMVFETRDQHLGWSGDYKNQSADPAVFVYYLTVKCGANNSYFEKGNITVMR